MDPVDNRTSSLLPPVELLRDEAFFVKQTEVVDRKLEEKMKDRRAMKVVKEMKENLLQRLEKKRSTIERLKEATVREQKLVKELEAAQLEFDNVKQRETSKTQEVVGQRLAAEKKEANYRSLVQSHTQKRDAMVDNFRQAEVLRSIISQILEQQGLEYVVNPEEGRVTAIKFYKVHPKRPGAEFVIHFKHFDVLDVSKFEVETITPMFPEFEEVSKKATESKNVLQLVLECLKHWKKNLKRIV